MLFRSISLTLCKTHRFRDNLLAESGCFCTAVTDPLKSMESERARHTDSSGRAVGQCITRGHVTTTKDASNEVVGNTVTQ